MKKRMLVFCLLLVSFAGFAQVYDRELENHRRKTREAFMQLMSQVSAKLSDTTLSHGQQAALFDPMLDYAQKEQPNYQKIRRKYLEEIPPPPAALADLHFNHLEDSDGIANVLADSNFTTVTLLQCYKPVEVGAVVNGLVQPLMYQKFGIGINEAAISQTFGHQVFAKGFQDGEWQIWLVNRAFVLRFTFDLANTIVRDLGYTNFNDPAYLKIQLPFVAYSPRFETDNHYLAMDEIRWDAYSIDLLKESSLENWRDTVNQKILTFYTKNQKRFHSLRAKILDDLDSVGTLDASWVEEKDLSVEENERFNEVLEPYFLHPGEVAYLLFSVTNGIPPFNEDINEIGKNAMVGFRHCAADVDGSSRWTIQSRGYSIAFEYTWDIQTGAITEIKLFNRQKSFEDNAAAR